MVDGTVPHLVVPGDFGVAEIADVDYVGCCEALRLVSIRSEALLHRTAYICGNTSPLKLIDLVVHDDVLLVATVQHGSLVDVASSGVCDFADDVGDIGFVGDVVDGHGVFVVSVADITPGIASVWTAVYQALRIVDVAVAGGTT